MKATQNDITRAVALMVENGIGPMDLSYDVFMSCIEQGLGRQAVDGVDFGDMNSVVSFLMTDGGLIYSDMYQIAREVVD